MNALATHLSALLLRLNGSHSDDLERAIPALCDAMEEGHVCLPASEWKGDITRLRECAVVGTGGDFKPLILDESGRLYLHRYWQYEDLLARAILARASAEVAPANIGASAVNPEPVPRSSTRLPRTRSG